MTNESAGRMSDASEPAGSAAQDIRREFVVVGMGGSAGAIPAFRDFFRNVPADSGMAYVVILHLSPDHDSRLAEVLQGTSAIPVMQVRERVKVEPNQVYVIPPNQSLSILDGWLVLSPIAGFEERRAPVDIFFRTLGEAHDSRAVCVILSGSGSDGSMGLRRIKEYNGLVLVQDPAEAQFDEMPRHSIATGLVDMVLPVAEMPARIMAYRDQVRGLPFLIEVRSELDEQALIHIFTNLRVRTGHDFSNYKRATVLRRIERRMALHGVLTLPQYAQLMSGREEEAELLLRELLISVTNFFRDAHVWQSVEEKVIPSLLEGKGAEDHVRVWVAGCATGEEAYSVAMLLAEAASGMTAPPDIQIFATDLDEDAIAKARNGCYSEADVADVSPERLRRHFVREQENFRVRRELRELVLFAHHNLLKDPPFSHIDFASCRNVLIYLNRAAQERTMELLHFALEAGGWLLLGTAESTDGSSQLFSTTEKEIHLYQSRAVPRVVSIPAPARQLTISSSLRAAAPPLPREPRAVRFTSLDLHQRLIEEYAPPSLIVDEDHNIVHLSERAGRYLLFAAGEATLNVLQVVRPELRIGLRTALFQAAQKRGTVILRGMDVHTGGRAEVVNVIVRPTLGDAETAVGFFLILFEETQQSAPVDAPSTIAEPAARQLEEELTRVRGQMRASVEQYEIQAEESKAANEELQAINEELRSTAEELETSQEELQSLNEELQTVNQELKVKIEEIGHTNDDLRNLMSSTEIGTIFVDRALRVKLFTSRVRELFNLIPADVGRPLLDINSKLTRNVLGTDLEAVLDRLQTIEREVESREGRWYLMRLLPYRTAEDRIDGVVLTFLEVTTQHRAQEVLLETQHRQAYLLRLSDALRDRDHPAEIQEAAGRVLGEQLRTGHAYSVDVDLAAGEYVVGPHWHRAEETSLAGRYPIESWPMPGLADGRIWSFTDVITDAALADEQRDAYREHGVGAAIVVPTIRNGKLVAAFATSQRRPRQWTEHEIGLVQETAERTWMAVERARAQVALRASEERLQRMVNVPSVGVLTFRPDGTIAHANDAFLEMVGYSREEFDARTFSWRDFTPDEYVEASQDVLAQLRETGRGGPYEKEYLRRDGSRIWFMFAGAVIGDGVIVEYALDVTDRKQAEALLRASEAAVAVELEDAKALQRISSQLIHEQNNDALYEDILDAAMALMRADMGSLQIVGRDGTSLRLLASKGFHPQSAAFWATVTETTQGSCGGAMASGVRQVIPDIAAAELVVGDDSRAEYARSGIRAVQSTPLFSRDGRVVGMISTHWREPHVPADRELRLFDVLARQAADVLERNRIEDALRSSEERYRTLFESIDQGFCIIEVLFDANERPTDYRFLEVNPAFERQTGLSDPLGKTMRELAPQHEEHWFEIYGEIARTRKPARFENEARALGRHYEVYGFPLGDSANRLAVLFNDITGRKNAELALRESEQRLQTVTNLVPDLLWSSDAGGSTDWCNERWLDYTGQSAEHACGGGWLEPVHADDREGSRAQFEEAIRTGEPLRLEHRMRAAAGDYRWFLVQAEPLRDARGRIVRWFGAATDIHEERVAREELEGRVKDRTRELADLSEQRQKLLHRLVAATEDERRRIARELHDEMGQHLTALRVLLQTVQPAGENVAHLKTIVDRLDQSIDRLTLELRPPTLDHLGLHGAITSLAEEFFAASGVRVDVHLPGVDAQRFADDTETAFYRVLQEALTNVWKHSGAKTVSVILERDGDGLRMIVEDDGDGFEGDGALDGDSARGRFGLLGMRERLALIGGSMHLESQPGSGTTLYVRAPVTEEPAQ